MPTSSATTDVADGTAVVTVGTSVSGVAVVVKMGANVALLEVDAVCRGTDASFESCVLAPLIAGCTVVDLGLAEGTRGIKLLRPSPKNLPEASGAPN